MRGIVPGREGGSDRSRVLETGSLTLRVRILATLSLTRKDVK